MTPARVLIDVTQYASWPATTGVQRTLLHITSHWRGDTLEARYGVLREDTFLVGPLELVAFVLREAFESPWHDPARSSVAEVLQSGADARIPFDRLPESFDAYFLPEPTLIPSHLRVIGELKRTARPVPFFIHYDALPLTHPHRFPRAEDGEASITAYNRMLADAPNIAFISEDAQRTFERRLARRPTEHPAVLQLGADALTGPAHGAHHTSASPRVPARFTLLGTVEPRKRHQLVLDAFDRLWNEGRDYELVIVGSRGCESAEVFTRLEAAQREGRLWWHEQASDRLVAKMISSSTAVIFVPEAEGYGLPAVEALAVGCPVIVSDMPSLHRLSEAGQIRLEHVDVDTLAAAIDRIAKPSENRRLRGQLASVALPGWSECVQSIQAWIDEGVERRTAA